VSSVPDSVVFIARFIAFAALHSLFASRRVKSVLCRVPDGEAAPYRLVYNLVSMAMLVWVVAAYRTSPVLYFVPGVWSLVMYSMQLIMLLLLADCVRQTGFRRFFGFSQDSSAEHSPPRLVTSGWYALVRHPLYLFSTLFMVLNPVMTAQWLLLTVMSLVYFIIGGVIEEKRLSQEFGDTYLEYRHRVPFMVPSLRRPELSR
jgi:protein-S-isoprenylcysteine O-methyltransferase Ste14